MIKYLYTFAKYSEKDVFRHEIIRETDHFVWLKNNIGNEYKISKKTYKDGLGWDSTYYYQEDERMLELFQSSFIKRKYLKKIEDLKLIKDIEEMKKILKILKNNV
jgi:hypothetical protein